MTEKYIAFDGKEFDNRDECLAYEKMLEFKKKAPERVVNFYNKMGKDYFNSDSPITIPESVKNCGTELGYLFSNIVSDLKTVCLDHSIEEIKNYIYSSLPDDKDLVDRFIDWIEIEEDVTIRKDWATALKNVRYGEKLSRPIRWSFSGRDISILAKLHKSNKFRKKIEDLLTDCNFHTECSDFSLGRYDEYIL